MTEISGKRQQQRLKRVKASKLHKNCRTVFFDCFTCFPNMLKILDVSNDTTAAGAGLWHERPSATGNGSRRMFVDVGGQATH